MNDDKSIPATDRRYREAREAGLAARSAELGAVSVIAAVAALVLVAGPSCVRSLKEMVSASMAAMGRGDIDVMDLVGGM